MNERPPWSQTTGVINEELCERIVWLAVYLMEMRRAGHQRGAKGAAMEAIVDYRKATGRSVQTSNERASAMVPEVTP